MAWIATRLSAPTPIQEFKTGDLFVITGLIPGTPYLFEFQKDTEGPGTLFKYVNQSVYNDDAADPRFPFGVSTGDYISREHRLLVRVLEISWSP